jgi:hypothetical protein
MRIAQCDSQFQEEPLAKLLCTFSQNVLSQRASMCLIDTSQKILETHCNLDERKLAITVQEIRDLLYILYDVGYFLDNDNTLTASMLQRSSVFDNQEEVLIKTNKSKLTFVQNEVYGQEPTENQPLRAKKLKKTVLKSTTKPL